MAMDVPHQLQALLQFLVTDASSITHLSYILDHLSPSCLLPSPHLQKWVIRVTSLMHSKDPAARWAAVCIAYRMSFLSRPLLIDNAQSWIGIVLPFLSKPEPVPIMRVSMRYLTLVLCVAQHSPEFQRQVVLPILPKVSSALLTIAEKYNDRDIKASSIQMLVQLVPLYPSSHKALSHKLFCLCYQNFNGSDHSTGGLLDSTVNLYSVLHFLGGKVGATSLWRNGLDEVLQFSWSAWLALRTTFPTSAQISHKVAGYLSDGRSSNSVLHAPTTADNPMATAALNLNKLKCGVSAICALLRAPVNRPVRLPIGHLAALCSCLFDSTLNDEAQVHFDLFARVAESSVVPQIWMLGCQLLSCLAETTQGLLAPHSPRLVSIISFHLEKDLDEPQKCSFLQCAYHLLYFCPIVGAATGINRLMKATISILSPLYLRPAHTEMNSGGAGQSKVTKKRRKEYEMDNILSTTNLALSEMTGKCDTLIAALDVTAQCMYSVLVPSTRSLANRVLLSILLSLTPMAPSSLECDLSFHRRLFEKVRDVCFESVRGIPYVSQQSKPTFRYEKHSQSLAARDKFQFQVDLLLHPRRPPFVQTLPFVESLSLSSAEESAEEKAIRHSLNLAFGNGEIRPIISEQQNRPDPVNQGSLTSDLQTAVDPPREEALPTSTEPQATSSEYCDLMIDDAASSPQVMPHQPAELPLPTFEQISAPSSCVVPMLIDESDHEEVPTIDFGSDSDA